MKLKITIIGNVHNVRYELHLLNLADSLFISRFDARNVHINGKQAVVVVVEGDKEILDEFVESVKTSKPEKAIVEEIKVEEFEGRVRTIDSYRNTLTIEQLNKIVQIGLKMLDKQDETINKIDEAVNKIDESTKLVSEKIDESAKTISEKIDNSTEKICSKIDDLRSNINHWMKG